MGYKELDHPQGRPSSYILAGILSESLRVSCDGSTVPQSSRSYMGISDCFLILFPAPPSMTSEVNAVRGYAVPVHWQAAARGAAWLPASSAC